MLLSRRTVPALHRLVHPPRRLLHVSTPVFSQRLNGVQVLEEELQADVVGSGFLEGEVSVIFVLCYSTAHSVTMKLVCILNLDGYRLCSSFCFVTHSFYRSISF
jgi:hypothetical protein